MYMWTHLLFLFLLITWLFLGGLLFLGAIHVILLRPSFIIYYSPSQRQEQASEACMSIVLLFPGHSDYSEWAYGPAQTSQSFP